MKLTRKQLKELHKMGFNSIKELQVALEKIKKEQEKQLRNRENDKFLSNEKKFIDFSILEEFESDFNFDFLDEE